MVTLRKSSERGFFDHGWLKTYHTFSFGDYHDPAFKRFRTLRVINEDFVAPSVGFPAHSHRDMEIVTYILEGSLEHRDSMGNTSIIQSGEVQKMSAGSGVTHSEYNPSAADPVHLLQIWIFPDQKNLEPGYQQIRFPPEEKKNRLRLIASGGKAEGVIRLQQDAKIYDCFLQKAKKINFIVPSGRGIWIQIIQGNLQLGSQTLETGDGCSIENESALLLESEKDTDFLLFDLG